MILADIATLLQDTAVELHRTEQILAKDPNDFVALTNMQSLLKRHADLTEQFEEMAAEDRMEVLYYRLIPKMAEPPIKSLNDLLSSFQQMFSVIFDSIATNTKKTRARIAESSLKASTLRFAYAFPGSVGFAMTLPEELILLNNDYNAALEAIKRIHSISSMEEVKEFAGDYGVAAARILFQWLDAIVRTDIDAEVKWAGSERNEFLVQVPDARAIRDLIAETSETETTDRNYRGTLLGYDSERRTFRFAIGNRKPIHGMVSEAVSRKLVVPEQYDVRVRVEIISRYSTEEKQEKFELLDITANKNF